MSSPDSSSLNPTADALQRVDGGEEGDGDASVELLSLVHWIDAVPWFGLDDPHENPTHRHAVHRGRVFRFSRRWGPYVVG